MGVVDQFRTFKARWIALPVVLVMLFFIWASDRITLQGERTVYTVICSGGAWDGDRCTGRVVVGPRFRYRALRAHREVLFWVLGAREPSYKLTDCEVQDGRNWTCPISADASKSLTLGMERGQPMRNASWPTQAFHAVSKVSWLLSDIGF